MSDCLTPYLNCIPADDSRPALAETLAFIHTHPISINDNPAPITLTLKICLLQNQFNPTDFPLHVSVNEVKGLILEVTSTYVVLTNTLPCSGEISEYTILLSSIIGLRSLSIESYFDEYITSMCDLFKICPDPYNPTAHILFELSKLLGDSALAENKISLLSSGLTTREYTIKNLTLVKNLLIQDKFFVTPLSQIEGFLLQE